MDKEAVKEVTALLQELVSDIACEEKRQRGELTDEVLLLVARHRGD